MRNKFLPEAVFVTLTFAAVSLWGPPSRAESRYHHELRGTILKVDEAKKEFTIKTYYGQVVECLINAKTVMKDSDGKRINFSEVHAGDRAYCHCDAMREGKHYSVYLLVKSRRLKHSP